MRDAYIWGAGNYGKQAILYFEKKYNIVGVIDNDKDKIGTSVFDVPIVGHQALNNVRDIVVIIAISNKYYRAEIEEILKKEYQIEGVIVFVPYCVKKWLDEERDDSEQLIVSFRSGLGNQMFQYALYKWLEHAGKNVFADLSDYIVLTDAAYSLEKVFDRIHVKKCNQTQKNNYEIRKQYGDSAICYQEEGMIDGRMPIELEELAALDSGIVKGYFQTHRIAGEVRNELLADFIFNVDKNSELKNLAEKIKNDNSVSIHVRRTDYLENDANDWFGGICTEEYYRRAIDFIKNNNSDVNLIFFSDDIKWVKDNYVYENATYIDAEMFETYQDWYDMYLMSLCKHNIIANSTFSWWGAWLNQNPDKIVIAPQKWSNMDAFKDICPEEWIRL